MERIEKIFNRLLIKKVEYERVIEELESALENFKYKLKDDFINSIGAKNGIKNNIIEDANELCRICDIELSDIIKKNRSANLVNKRFIIMYFLKHEYSFVEIGKLFDMHHSTIINAVNKVKLWKSIRTYNKELQLLEESIKKINQSK